MGWSRKCIRIIGSAVDVGDKARPRLPSDDEVEFCSRRYKWFIENT